MLRQRVGLFSMWQNWLSFRAHSYLCQCAQCNGILSFFLLVILIKFWVDGTYSFDVILIVVNLPFLARTNFVKFVLLYCTVRVTWISLDLYEDLRGIFLIENALSLLIRLIWIKNPSERKNSIVVWGWRPSECSVPY